MKTSTEKPVACPACGLPREFALSAFGSGWHPTGSCEHCFDGVEPREQQWGELSDVMRERMRDGSHE